MLINCFLAAVVVMLTIKLWIMTGDVRKIQQQLAEPQTENRKIIEAQLKALEGKSEEAYALYKEAYYYSLVLFFNELETKAGKQRNERKVMERRLPPYNILLFHSGKTFGKLFFTGGQHGNVRSDQCTNRETLKTERF